MQGRPATRKTQKSLFINHIAPLLPKKLGDVEELATEMMKNWESEDLAPATRRQLLSLLSKYIKFKKKANVSFTSHARTIPLPTHERTVWDEDQCRRALRWAMYHDLELYKMMLTTLHTGIRKGELFGLRWKDIDFFTGRLKVSKSYDGPTKNGRPRAIPLTLELEDLLNNDYTVGKEDELIFKRCDPNDRLKAVCRGAKIPEITWHGMRHYFATRALEAGRSPRRVAAILGHSKVSTTLDIYWQSTGEDMNMDFIR